MQLIMAQGYFPNAGWPLWLKKAGKAGKAMKRVVFKKSAGKTGKVYIYIYISPLKLEKLDYLK